MSDSMKIEREVKFNATTEQVWDLLTLPELTKQYMFGCEVLSDWKAGSPIQWKGLTEEDKEIVYVKGEIQDIELYKYVSFTMFDPNMGIKDIPENYVTLTYRLESQDGFTKLDIFQSDLTGKENDEKRYQESLAGWDMVIPLMQKLIA